MQKTWIFDNRFSCKESSDVSFKYIYFLIDALVYSNAAFGSGSGSIFLDNVGCNGGESSLLDCYYVSSTCSHSEDVGVRCQGFLLVLSFNK